ncbi:hypothetical protein [Actinoplanes teichomyceticus]|uniref:Uncharacterized protein n=1 Tax=Actinoplanes teichomyceticus TaxID=1867 RepID=A0A561WAW7_ACTTI|nr:hypothetical protein [Actinoplanes teichomyceticus]TWG20993.1 hypothetical protein FHX34_103522 [Actinoplanes teichomyceticus]
MAELFYGKYGTRIAVPDEGDESIQNFAYSGTRAMLAGSIWELLPGPVERVPGGTYDGDEVVVYLWPVAREVGERRG